MKIILGKNNNKYHFNIADNKGNIVYASNIHYFLVPFVKSDYKYAWEACRDAWKLAYKAPHHIASIVDMEKPVRTDISSERMLINHYLGTYKSLRIKSRGAATKDEKKMTYEEVKKVISELETIGEQIDEKEAKNKIDSIYRLFKRIISKYFAREERESAKEQKIASTTLDKNQVADEYAQHVCKAIEKKHNDAYYVVSYPNITIFNFKNEPLLKIGMNKGLNVDSIVPCYKISALNPLHSAPFYQKYFKPIVENIGHYSIDNKTLMLTKNLPDFMDKEATNVLKAWDVDNNEECSVALCFRGKNPTWFFERPDNIKEAMVSQYTSSDYSNAIVKCVDKNLKSIHERTGVVMQVLPRKDLIEIDVDFGSGIGIVRLTENQIEKVAI